MSALPLVTSAQLSSRAGQEVRIIGKVQKVSLLLTKVSGDVLLLEASDNGTVEIKLQMARARLPG